MDKIEAKERYIDLTDKNPTVKLVKNFASVFEKARQERFPSSKKLSNEELALAAFEVRMCDGKRIEAPDLLPTNIRFQCNIGKLSIVKGCLLLSKLPIAQLKQSSIQKLKVFVCVYT